MGNRTIKLDPMNAPQKSTPPRWLAIRFPRLSLDLRTRGLDSTSALPESRLTAADGSTVELKGDEEIEYDGEVHTAANLFDALKEGYYGKF